MDLLKALDEEAFNNLPEEEFESLQKEETIDLLDNLGYVVFHRNNKSSSLPTVPQIRKGIRIFREELRQSRLNQKLFTLTEELSEEELDFLADLSDLEGGFRLQDYTLNEIKGDPLLCRILNYRLNILSVLGKNDVVNCSYDNSTSNALTKLGKWVGVTKKTELIALSDDFNELIKSACKNEKLGNFRNMAFFQYQGSDTFDTSSAWFENYIWIIPEKDRTFYKKEVINNSWLTKKARKHIAGIIDNPANTFFIRLVQLKLSLIGSYGGKIDGEMAGFSVGAIQDLYDMVKETEGDRLDEYVAPDRVLFKLGKGYWAMNYKYLLLHGIPTIGFDKIKTEENVYLISDKFNSLIDAAKSEKEKKQILETIVESYKGIKENGNVRRKKRIRKGRGIFKTVVRFFKKIGSWVKNQFDKLLNALKRFFKTIKNGITYLIREIKEAFRKIRMALGFFFSKRTISTSSQDNSQEIETDFDMDFDVINYIKGPIDENTYSRHAENIDITLQAMESSFKIFQVVIPVLIKLASGPLGWIQAGISLIKILIEEKFDHKIRLLKFLP